MFDYQSALERIQNDPRYQKNLDWGKPRRGHPEGTVRAHIAELEENLRKLQARVSETDAAKLRLLVHVHDSFKAESDSGVAITDPRSHASLARSFLAEFCDDADLLAMVQYHDEPFALFRQFTFKGSFNADRMAALLAKITDWNLFHAFMLIDGCTKGKERDSLRWFFGETAGKVPSTFTAADIME